MKYVPNALSVARMLAAVLLVYLILIGEKPVCALAVCVFAAITDFLDGYLARRLHITSELGAMLDPLADKLMIILSFAALACVGSVPSYVAATVIGRDVLILSAVIMCKIHRVPLKIEPLMSSKINTTVQVIFLIMVLTCNCFPWHVPYLIECGSVVVVISTVFSGAEYVQRYRWIRDKIFPR
ncbi:MAG: CDP-alcohol phosphatidyltransferase family protein [Holosporaceae bacterium]|jgi:cardiolipin synthase|nr:CDP-alcohol phosphatidyltransferase family protein [Holosporaceae bacterium]